MENFFFSKALNSYLEIGEKHYVMLVLSYTLSLIGWNLIVVLGLGLELLSSILERSLISSSVNSFSVTTAVCVLSLYLT